MLPTVTGGLLNIVAFSHPLSPHAAMVRSGPVSLDVGRLRLAAAGVAVAMSAAVLMLTPPSRGGLILYATGDGAERVAAAFTGRTGVPVTFVRLSTGPLLARIAAEGRRPSWTLAWFDGDTSAATLDRAGLLARGAAPGANWSALGRWLLPRDGAWTPVAATLAGVTVRLRTPPRTMASVSGAELGMADPALAGSAYLQLAGLLADAGGWPAARGVLLGLRGRVEVAATSPNVVAELKDHRVRRGWLQGSTAFFLASRDPEVLVEPVQTGVVLPSVIVEAAGASPERRSEAERFLRFATSDAVQTARMTGGRVDAFAWATVKTRTSPPAGLPPLRTVRLVHLDPYRWGAVQAAVTDTFEAEVARR